MRFDVITRERMVVTSIDAARGDTSGFVRMIEGITDPRRTDALRKALTGLRAHSSSDWNEVYIATTQAGQTYRGTLAGQAGQDFMMRVDAKPQAWIAIGDARDLPAGARSGQSLTLTAPQFGEQISPAVTVDAAWRASKPIAADPTGAPMLDADRLHAFEARMVAQRQRLPSRAADENPDAAPDTPKQSTRTGPGF